MDVETLIHARWIIPVQPASQILAHYSIAIDHGKIIALLRTYEAQAEICAKTTVTLAQHALIPGLINMHTHAAMCLFRGFADDLTLQEWLNNRILPAEKKWVSPEFVSDGSYIAIAEMLRSGTTCFNDMYFYPEHTAAIAAQLGMRAVIGLLMLDFPTAWASDPETYLIKGRQLHDKYKQHPLITTACAPHAPYTVSDEPLRWVAALADELNIPIHMHIHETAAEVQQGVKQDQRRPLQRLHELGLVNGHLIAVHMTQLQLDEINLLAKAGTHIAHCPESNLKLASGICPLGQLLDNNINVCIGTDSAASNNDLDLLAEMRTAALLANNHTNSNVTADTILTMATINAARALGMEQRIGSLCVGKEADIVAIDLGQIETQPVYNPVSQLVYAASRGQVSDVWVAGNQLLQGRKLTQINTEQLLQKAITWQARIAC